MVDKAFEEMVSIKEELRSLVWQEQLYTIWEHFLACIINSVNS